MAKKYLDRSLPIVQRVDDLVARMSLEEKISQMVHDAPAIPRLGISAYNWWNECCHGVGRAGQATVFPQAIGMAASFNEKLLHQTAIAISNEARAKHHAALKRKNHGMYFGLTYWTPNINIFRDPRWGRGQETYGEDPYLASRMGIAFVKGLQGSNPRYLKLAATPKHFAVHSGPESERHRFDAVVSRRDLHETYLPAFKACITKGKAISIMGAYNRTNGEACCAHTELLSSILRNQWKFEGYVVSDCWAIADFHQSHKITAYAAESAALAVTKGCDLCCGSEYPSLRDAVARGRIDESSIDIAVKRLFTARMKLGMFDPPSRVPYAQIPISVVDCRNHRGLARRMARESIVLLKNRANTLPLSKDTGRISVSGPLAGATDVLYGNYHGLNGRMVSILEGIAAKRPFHRGIEYSPGCLTDSPNRSKLDWIINGFKTANAVILCMGLTPLHEGEEGDAIASVHNGDRIDNISLPQNQIDFIRRACAVSTRVILVLACGSAISLPQDIIDNTAAILVAWYPGEEGGNAVADVLFGDYNPSGRLPVTVVKSIEQLPPFDDYNMKGRTYRFMDEKPLFMFGSGLSYTNFGYSRLKLSKKVITPSEPVTVSVDVKNTGKRPGDEVVQVYVSDTQASVPVPRLHLEGFKKIHLKSGQRKRVTFSLAPEQLACFNDEGKPFVEPGEFRIWAGGGQPGGAPGCTTLLTVR